MDQQAVASLKNEASPSERAPCGEGVYRCTLVRLINFGSFGLSTNLPAFDQISLFNDCSLCKLARSTEGTTVASARVLLVGLDPDIVDYTKSPVLGLNGGQSSCR
jgi:hypothetical protein